MFDLSPQALDAVRLYDNPYRQQVETGMAAMAKHDRLRSILLRRLFPGVALPAVIDRDGVDAAMTLVSTASRPPETAKGPAQPFG